MLFPSCLHFSLYCSLTVLHFFPFPLFAAFIFSFGSSRLPSPYSLFSFFPFSYISVFFLSSLRSLSLLHGFPFSLLYLCSCLSVCSTLSHSFSLFVTNAENKLSLLHTDFSLVFYCIFRTCLPTSPTTSVLGGSSSTLPQRLVCHSSSLSFLHFLFSFFYWAFLCISHLPPFVSHYYYIPG